MVKRTQFVELDFTHFVVVTGNGTVFGCAKRDGHVYNFLIRRDSVQQQSGDNWETLDAELADIIRSRVQDAYERVPVYRTEKLHLE